MKSMEEDTQEEGEVKDLYHLRPPPHVLRRRRAQESSTTQERTPTKTASTEPRRSPRHLQNNGHTFVIVRIIISDVTGIDARIDIPKILVFSQGDLPSLQSTSSVLKLLQDKSDKRYEHKFDYCKSAKKKYCSALFMIFFHFRTDTCAPKAASLASFLSDFTASGDLDLVPEVSLQSLSLVQTHDFVFTDRTATVVGLSPGTNGKESTEDVLKFLFAKHLITLSFHHRSEGKACLELCRVPINYIFISFSKKVARTE